MGGKWFISFAFLLLAVPVRAQWSGHLDLSGGYGLMPAREAEERERLDHGLIQLNGRIQYKNPQWTWKTTLDGKWEPKGTDSERAASKNDIEAVVKESRTRPLTVGLRSDLSWTPGADRKYDSWIRYQYKYDEANNQTLRLNLSLDWDDGKASYYYEQPLLSEHLVAAGVQTSHQLGAPWRVLLSSLSLEATMNQQYNLWSVTKAEGFSAETLEEDIDATSWVYRITPQKTDLNTSGLVHLRDSVLRGPVKLVLDPGVRVASQHNLDMNSGATLDLELFEKTGEEVWRDSVRLRERFDYRTLRLEPYLAADFSWQALQAHVDYALQFYSRRLNDDDHTQRLSLYGVYPVGNGSISWRPSGRHRLSLNNRLSVAHPDYYKICWYERTGGYLNQLYRGNDKLRSTVTRLYSLEYEFKPGPFSSNTTLSVTRRKNETEQTWKNEEIEGRLYKVFTWINAADGWTLGATERLGWSGKVVSAHLGVGYNRTRRTARETGAVKETFDWNLTADASVELGRGWNIRSDVRYQSKVATFFSMFNEYCVLNARVQKRFPRFTVYLEGRDLLDNVRVTSFESADGKEKWVESVRNNRRLVVLGLSWDIK